METPAPEPEPVFPYFDLDGFDLDWSSVRSRVSAAGGYLFKGLLCLAWMGLSIAAVVLLSPMLVATSPAAGAVDAAATTRAPATEPTAVPAGQAGAGQSAAQLLPMSAAGATNPAPVGGETSAAADARETPTVEAAPTAPPPTPQSPTAVPATPAPTRTPAQGEKVYVVQKKDTLYSLAKANGITVEELMEANGLTDKNFIWVGQRLIIPPPRS